jgi:citrate lyase beta subunit
MFGRVRRALLYAPDLKKIQKAAGLGVDSICMDLEDGVAASAKATARAGIVQALATVDFGKSERVVRINAVGTGHESDDLHALFSTKTQLPDAIVLPKVQTADDVRWVAAEIDRLAGQQAASVRLIALIESAQGLLNLPAITATAPTTRLDALIFGADDYAAVSSMCTVGTPACRVHADLRVCARIYLCMCVCAYVCMHVCKYADVCVCMCFV